MIELTVDHLGSLYDAGGKKVDAKPVCGPQSVAAKLGNPDAARQELDSEVEHMELGLLLQDITGRQGVDSVQFYIIDKVVLSQ